MAGLVPAIHALTPSNEKGRRASEGCPTPRAVDGPRRLPPNIFVPLRLVWPAILA